MILYFNKTGELTTVIPHGEPVRQYNNINMYVYLDEDFFEDEEDREKHTFNLELTMPKVGATSSVPQIMYYKGITQFKKLTDSEITYDLVDNKTYICYYSLVQSGLSTVYPGNLVCNISIVKTKDASSTEVVDTQYLGMAQIFVERTFGSTKRVSDTSAAQYQQMLNQLNNFVAKKEDKENVGGTINYAINLTTNLNGTQYTDAKFNENNILVDNDGNNIINETEIKPYLKLMLGNSYTPKINNKLGRGIFLITKEDKKMWRLVYDSTKGLYAQEFINDLGAVFNELGEKIIETYVRKDGDNIVGTLNVDGKLNSNGSEVVNLNDAQTINGAKTFKTLQVNDALLTNSIYNFGTSSIKNENNEFHYIKGYTDETGNFVEVLNAELFTRKGGEITGNLLVRGELKNTGDTILDTLDVKNLLIGQLKIEVTDTENSIAYTITFPEKNGTIAFVEDVNLKLNKTGGEITGDIKLNGILYSNAIYSLNHFDSNGIGAQAIVCDETGGWHVLTGPNVAPTNDNLIAVVGQLNKFEILNGKKLTANLESDYSISAKTLMTDSLLGKDTYNGKMLSFDKAYNTWHYMDVVGDVTSNENEIATKKEIKVLEERIDSISEVSPEIFDTFKEISQYIKNDESGANGLISSVVENKEQINTLKENVENLTLVTSVVWEDSLKLINDNTLLNTDQLTTVILNDAIKNGDIVKVYISGNSTYAYISGGVIEFNVTSYELDSGSLEECICGRGMYLASYPGSQTTIISAHIAETGFETKKMLLNIHNLSPVVSGGVPQSSTELYLRKVEVIRKK